MKIINTTIGRNPPVVRMNSFVQKAVCYRLELEPCETWEDGTDEIKFLPNIPNELGANTKNHVTQYIPNQGRTYDSVGGYSPLLLNRQRPNQSQDYKQRIIEHIYPPNSAIYRITTEKELVLEDYVPIAKENKFKILLPRLPEGFYYLDVWCRNGFNRVMLNVCD